MDDDAVVQPGWLSAIIASYADESIGGVGGPVLNMNGDHMHGQERRF